MITPTLVIAEMHSAYIRNNQEKKFLEDLELIGILSVIENTISEKNAITAGFRHAKNRTKEISYVDCILWALAEERGMKVLSVDTHFRGCPQAVYVRKEGKNGL